MQRSRERMPGCALHCSWRAKTDALPALHTRRGVLGAAVRAAVQAGAAAPATAPGPARGNRNGRVHARECWVPYPTPTLARAQAEVDALRQLLAQRLGWDFGVAELGGGGSDDEDAPVVVQL